MSSQVIFVMLTTKKIKRRRSSKRFRKSKATVELPKQGREQQVEESKRERKHWA